MEFNHDYGIKAVGSYIGYGGRMQWEYHGNTTMISGLPGKVIGHSYGSHGPCCSMIYL